MASRASGKRGSSNGGNAVVGEGKGSVGRGTAGGDLPRETLEATGVDVDDGVGGDWGDSGRVGDCGRSWRGGRASSGKLSSAGGFVVLPMLGVSCRRIGAGVGRRGRGEVGRVSCSARSGRWRRGCVQTGLISPLCAGVRGVPRRAKTGDDDRGRCSAVPLLDSALRRTRKEGAGTKGDRGYAESEEPNFCFLADRSSA
jgi:hypothetical protein